MARLDPVGTFVPRTPEVTAYQLSSGSWMVDHVFGRIFLTNAQFHEHYLPADALAAGVQGEPDDVIRLPITPGRSVRPNANSGHSKGAGMAYGREKARLRKESAQIAGSWAIGKYGDQITKASPLYPDTSALVVTVAWEKTRTAGYPNGRYRSFVDAHDALPLMCKGIIDGLVDAHVLADDRHLEVEYQQIKDPDGMGYVDIAIWRGVSH